jgi:hypothetical protein
MITTGTFASSSRPAVSRLSACWSCDSRTASIAADLVRPDGWSLGLDQHTAPDRVIFGRIDGRVGQQAHAAYLDECGGPTDEGDQRLLRGLRGHGFNSEPVPGHSGGARAA